MVASVTKNNETYVSRKMRVQAAPKVLSGAVSDIQLDECRLLQVDNTRSNTINYFSQAVSVILYEACELCGFKILIQ